MSIVFPYKVVKVSFIYEIVSINAVEKGRQSQKRSSWYEGKNNPVPGEKVDLQKRDKRFFTFKYCLSITVDKKEKRDTIDYWIYLKVNRNAIHYSSNYVLFFQQKVEWSEHKSNYNVIIGATSAHPDSHGIVEPERDVEHCVSPVSVLGLNQAPHENSHGKIE